MLKIASWELIPPVTVEFVTPVAPEWLTIISPAKLAIDPANVKLAPIKTPMKIAILLVS